MSFIKYPTPLLILEQYNMFSLIHNSIISNTQTFMAYITVDDVFWPSREDWGK